MARLWLDEPPKTGYGSVLIQIELGATDRTKKAHLVAADHNYKVKPSVGLHFAWVPLALAQAQTKLHLEVELGRGQWVKVSPVYRLARGDEDTAQALTLDELRDGGAAIALPGARPSSEAGQQQKGRTDGLS